MQNVTPGSTDVTVTLAIVDSGDGTPETGVTSATAGLALWYRKGATGAKVAISVSDLSALTDAHSDGGLLHISDGLFRLDVPDAAVPASEHEVTTVGGTATGMVVLGAALVGKPAELGGTAQTGDTYARLGAPAGASIAADIAGVAAGVWGYSLATVQALATTTIGRFIADKLGIIGTGTAFAPSPVDSTGNVLTVQGMSYKESVGTGLALNFVKESGSSWPTDLNSGTPVVTATIKVQGTDLTFTGSVVVATGASQQVRVELSTAQSATIPANERGGWDFVIEWTDGTEKARLWKGRWRSEPHP